MPLVANVLFHKTPCCGASFSLEYPHDMKANEEWVDKVICSVCKVKYQVVLYGFKKGYAKGARWLILAPEPARDEGVAQCLTIGEESGDR